ncbi:MAG TPA: hypothetical protein VLR88_01805 [Propionibacteriaceae bacterium]|nr:hypothetical protein [Propionibacteriaceae bacterium]
MRRVLASAVAVLLLTLASGCAAPLESTDQPSNGDPGAIAQRLTRALAGDDSASFQAAFADADAAQFLAVRLWRNLSQFTDPAITAHDGTLSVTWRVPGDARPAVDVLSARWADSPEGERQLASLAPMSDQRVPLWFSDDLTVVAAQGCTLIVPAASPRDLSRTCANAATRVSDAGLAILSPTWTRTLVVEIPATNADFASLTGTDPADNVGVGGLTHHEGVDPVPGPARAVLNPATAWSAPLDQVESLLAHEGVHHALADRTPALPLWVSEGLADHVALPASPGWKADVAQRLVAAYTGGSQPHPLRMPTDADFAGDAVTDHADLQLAYDTAWLMVDTLLSERGSEEGLADLGRLASGDSSVTSTQWLTWAHERIESLAR